MLSPSDSSLIAKLNKGSRYHSKPPIQWDPMYCSKMYNKGPRFIVMEIPELFVKISLTYKRLYDEIIHFNTKVFRDSVIMECNGKIELGLKEI